MNLTGVSFQFATLRGTKFDSATLTAANFDGTKMGGAILTKATAKGASFRRADLTRAMLNGAALEGAKFNSATLTVAGFEGATFDAETEFLDASIIGVDLSSCNLTLAKFSATRKFYDDLTKEPTAEKPRTAMRKATIPIALLGTSDWSWLDLEGATINGQLPDDLTGFKAVWTWFPTGYTMPKRKLDSANFQYATLMEVDLSESKADTERPPDFSFANMRRAKMSAVRLPHAIFNEARMHGITLTNAFLSAAKFTTAHLDSEGTDIADLSSALLMDADFTGASLGSTSEVLGANLSYAIFFGNNATLARATLPRAQFSGAYMVGMNFQNIEGKAMQSAIFAGACLANCLFNGASLAGVTLTGTCLQGADFTDSSLFGAKMSNAAVALAAGTLEVTGLPFGTATIEYQATKIAKEVTNGQTVCPSSANGPCDGAKWTSPNAPMTAWRYGPK